VGPGPPSREARTDKDLAPRRWYNSTFQLLLHNRPRITPLPSLSCRSAKLRTSGMVPAVDTQPGLLKRVLPFDFRGPSPWGLFCVFRMANVSGGLYPLTIVVIFLLGV
jgi:hypothetical protein